MAARDGKIGLLKNVAIFSACSSAQLRMIARITDQVHVPAGATLIHEGRPGRELFVISSGTARISRNGRKIRDLGTGESFGELALIDQGPRSATVTAATDMDLYVVHARHFTDLLREAPGVTMQILRGLAERVRTAEKSPTH